MIQSRDCFAGWRGEIVLTNMGMILNTTKEAKENAIKAIYYIFI